MPSNSYTPSYRSPYTPKCKTQVKSFNNNTSIDSNNYTSSSFIKTGFNQVNLKTLVTSPFYYKTTINSTNS